MNEYPIQLRLSGRRCAVLGGGAVAERKVRDLLDAGADVTIISPRLSANLQQLKLEQKFVHIPRDYRSGDVCNFFMVFCATDDQEVNRQAAVQARENGALVNVADSPDDCDFTLPARVQHGDLVLTVSTSGVSPAFARLIREELELGYGSDFAVFLIFLREIRGALKSSRLSAGERVAFWREALDLQLLELLRKGRIKEAEEKVRYAIGSIGIKS